MVAMVKVTAIGIDHLERLLAKEVLITTAAMTIIGVRGAVTGTNGADITLLKIMGITT